MDRGYLANIKHVMKMKNRDLYIRNVLSVWPDRCAGRGKGEDEEK